MNGGKGQREDTENIDSGSLTSRALDHAHPLELLSLLGSCQGCNCCYSNDSQESPIRPIRKRGPDQRTPSHSGNTGMTCILTIQQIQ